MDSLILCIFGDILGFDSYNVKFAPTKLSKKKYGDEYKSKAYELATHRFNGFLYNGSINKEIDKLKYSFSTLMLFATLKGLSEGKDYKKNCIKEYTKLYDKYTEKKLNQDYLPTNNYIESLHALVKNESITQDSKYNDSMVLSRVAPFGLIFWKKEQRSKLITEIIENISITHKNNIVYLCGITIGLFISFKKNGIDAHKWGHKLTEYLLSSEFDNIIKENKMYSTEFILDKEDYVSLWNAYLDSSFKNDRYVSKPVMMDPSYRANFLFLTFNDPYANEFVYGLKAEECIIIAYDSLLYCEGYFEKMFIVGALGITNNSVMGAICGILFGVEYGINNSINKNIFKNEAWLKKLLILTKNINI